MIEQTKDDRQRRGFSSRWILGNDVQRTGTPLPGTVAGDARAAAQAIDTDGDGVADTLALRVDSTPAKRSALGAFGRWIARSFVTIVVVASLVAAAAGAAATLSAREQLDDSRIRIAELDATLQATRTELDDQRLAVVEAREDASTSTVDAASLEAERDELELEVRVLRRMLLDAERRASER